MTERDQIPDIGTTISEEVKLYINGQEQTRDNFNKRIVWALTPSEKVLKAFSEVDRREFSPDEYKQFAYTDQIIPLEGATISQPSLIAKMVDSLDLTGRDFVLEIGTASGYTSAIISKLAARVDTIECNKTLANNATNLLKQLGFSNIYVHNGDGAAGYVQRAPYDAIILTAAVKHIPEQLNAQLKEGGRIVAPVGEDPENTFLTVSRKINGELISAELEQVWFIPLISEIPGGWKSEEEYQEAKDASSWKKRELFGRGFFTALAEKAGVQPGALLYALENLKDTEIE